MISKCTDLYLTADNTNTKYFMFYQVSFVSNVNIHLYCHLDLQYIPKKRLREVEFGASNQVNWLNDEAIFFKKVTSTDDCNNNLVAKAASKKGLVL